MHLRDRVGPIGGIAEGLYNLLMHLRDRVGPVGGIAEGLYNLQVDISLCDRKCQSAALSMACLISGRQM